MRQGIYNQKSTVYHRVKNDKAGYETIHKAMSGEMCNNIFNSGYNLGIKCQFIFATFLCFLYCFHIYCFVFSEHTFYFIYQKKQKTVLIRENCEL